ncbi:MAG: hypothetical protein JKY65_18560 [Planctomycetes bacterium]|nr:hypothetical protein [Planctomycetota bacterium]
MRIPLTLLSIVALAGFAQADPQSSPAAFDELVLTYDYLGASAPAQPGPTRRVLRVRADGRMQLERTHPLLHFAACRGRATRTEIDRLVRLLPTTLPGAVGPGFSRPDPSGRTGFRLARRRGEAVDQAAGLTSALGGASLEPLCDVLEGLARRLVALGGGAQVRLEGRVLVRPLGGKFEVLIASAEGEISVRAPLAAALRPLKGYSVVVEGEVGAGGAIEAGRLLDPQPVRLQGTAVRLGAKPGLRLSRGRALQAVGPRRGVLGAARGHKVEVAGWRFRSGRLLIDSVGALCKVGVPARRRKATVATHTSGDGLRVLHVARARRLALVQSSGGGRIGWVPSESIRWSEDAKLPPPEGSVSMVKAISRVDR